MRRIAGRAAALAAAGVLVSAVVPAALKAELKKIEDAIEAGKIVPATKSPV